MIEDIKNISIPDYAEFKDASAQLQDMGEKTITANVEIAGGVVPDFSSDWEVEFQGERYIMPLRSPQGSRDNTKLSSSLSLTFQHWAIYQLKRYYFVTLQPIESGTAIADKYEASVNLNLHDFCDLFGQVLNHYYGEAIKVDLNPSWVYESEPATVEISHSYIWDVLAEVYNLYGVRWQITGSGHDYTIKLGYPTNEVSHIFEQGFSGGLLKVERQVQNDNIRNKIIGRGGNENLPYRYFKKKDDKNDTFSPDPDWIPELANIYFDKLRGATFRSYVQGWKQKHYGGASVTSADNAYAPWAWQKGYTDAKFDPVEYVKDDESIARYGELYGGYDNDDIKPTIQGITIDPIGRVDEVVGVEKILTDDYSGSEEHSTMTTNIGSMEATDSILEKTIKQIETGYLSFSVPEGKIANINRGGFTQVAYRYDSKNNKIDESGGIVVKGITPYVYNKKTFNTVAYSNGIKAGDYHLRINVTVENTTDYKLNATIWFETINIILGDAEPIPEFQNTWDIWVKNIWQTEKEEGETDVQYAERVWRPILGDKDSNEAKVVFSDGMLAFSSDYNFQIISIPQRDQSKIINGVRSEWKITLGKSDADLETLGVYQPSVERFAVEGDHFYFTGIDMPHLYVLWAEERLDDFKKDQLNEVKDIKPSWLVSPDKVRIGEAGAAAYGETETLLSQLHIGDTFRLADQVFIKDTAYETLYLQSITYNYKDTLNPDVEIVLSNDYAVSANPVSELQGEVSSLQRQVGSLSNIEQVVRAVGDKIYLRKDGVLDRSVSPTEFLSKLTGGGFRAGIVGGSGWGFYQDENKDWVLEIDQMKVRHELNVNTLVINQVTAQGGIVIESAAAMTVTNVAEVVSNGTAFYICYFDSKSGSVPNLFKIGDVVMCNAFDSSANSTKFYKRRVGFVSSDRIYLYKSSYVNGNGIPAVGDVLVQYGSYTNANRRFVKIRDVVGGGYERYISGLSSVNTDGEEYYFVGRQSGSYNGKERFFLGTQGGNHIEYLNGVLSVSGNIAIGTTGLENFTEWQSKQTQIDNAESTAQSAQSAANDLQYLAGIFPSGNLVAGGAVLAKFLGVMDGNNVVAGINGSQDTNNYLYDTTHKKLMLFAGATSLDNAKNATTQIYEDGYFKCGKIEATGGKIGDFYISSFGTTLDTSDGVSILYGQYTRLSKMGLECYNKVYASEVYNRFKKNIVINTNINDYPVLDIDASTYDYSSIYNKDIKGLVNIEADGLKFDTAIHCKFGMFAGLRPRTIRMTSSEITLSASDNVVLVDYKGNSVINLPDFNIAYGAVNGQYFDIHGLYDGTARNITLKTKGTSMNIPVKNKYTVSSHTILSNESARIIYLNGIFYLFYI